MNPKGYMIRSSSGQLFRDDFGEQHHATIWLVLSEAQQIVDHFRKHKTMLSGTYFGDAEVVEVDAKIAGECNWRASLNWRDYLRDQGHEFNTLVALFKSQPQPATMMTVDHN